MTEPTPASPSSTGAHGGHDAVHRSGATKATMPQWLFRILLVVAAAAALVVIYLIASVTVPLMWANSIRDQVGSQLGNSIPIGMFYGFVFTFVPLLIAWQARRSNFHKWVRISLVAAGVLLLIPNVLTLAVLYGSSQTAADARSIWANSANWFGTWSQIFMLFGVIAAIAGIVVGRMWMRRGKKLRELKAAEKVVRNNQLVQDRAATEAARAAERATKAAARAKRHAPAAKAPQPGSDSTGGSDVTGGTDSAGGTDVTGPPLA